MIFQNTEIISVPDIYLDVLTGCYTSKQLDWTMTVVNIWILQECSCNMIFYELSLGNVL